MSTCTSCGGTIEDGYCNVCGLAAARSQLPRRPGQRPPQPGQRRRGPDRGAAAGRRAPGVPGGPAAGRRGARPWATCMTGGWCTATSSRITSSRPRSSSSSLTWAGCAGSTATGRSTGPSGTRRRRSGSTRTLSTKACSTSTGSWTIGPSSNSWWWRTLVRRPPSRL